jgi:hypothetical protein
MTFTISEISLCLMAVSVFTGVLAVFNLRRRVGDAADETRKTMIRLGDLTPRLERSLEELAGVLQELQKVTKHTEAVVADAEVVSGEIRAGVQTLRIARRSRAAAAAARAGFVALRDLTSAPSAGNGGPERDSPERTGRRDRFHE